MNSENSSTFAEILAQEDYVICDTCASSLGGSIYDIFSNRDLLYNQAETLNCFIDLLNQEKVYVTPGVSSELQKADAIFGKIRKSINSHKRKVQQRRRGDTNSKLETLEYVHRLAHEAFIESKHSVFQPEYREKYNLLENIVLDVTKEKHAKIDFGILYERSRPKKDHSNTDEQIVASALYLSTVAERQCGILTRDSDIRRILVCSMLDKRIEPLANLIGKNRIRIYRPVGPGRAYPDFDSLGFKPN